MYDTEYEPSEADLEEMSDYFAEIQYLNRKWDVRCDSCGDADRDTQKNLEAKGWTLNKTETCFRCTDVTEYRRAA